MVRRLMQQVLALRFAASSDVPSPSGSLNAHASGADSVRVLLVGGEQALGLGVLSTDLALQGRLARRIADATGQGVDVVVVADAFLVVADAKDAVLHHDLSRFDAVVFALGTAEAMSLTPVASWSRDIRELLMVTQESGHPQLSVFITSVPGVPHRPGRHPSLGAAAARRHANRLNEQLTAAVTPFDVTLLPFVPTIEAEGERFRSSATYDSWAAQLAPAISRTIVGTRVPHRASDDGDEVQRQSALDGLGILDTAPEDRFDQIARTARAVFGVGSAGIGLIDQDREWFKARAGDLPQELARSIAICDVTIQQDGILVVPDTTLDDRFRSNPFVTGPDPVRFYAGYPIESENGERVGTLCVSDTAPREFSIEDRRLLRDLALLAQKELTSGRRAMRPR